MKRVLLVAFLAALAAASQAQTVTHVKGQSTKNGTYVAGGTRSKAGKSTFDTYSGKSKSVDATKRKHRKKFLGIF